MTSLIPEQGAGVYTSSTARNAQRHQAAGLKGKTRKEGRLGEYVDGCGRRKDGRYAVRVVGR